LVSFVSSLVPVLFLPAFVLVFQRATLFRRLLSSAVRRLKRITDVPDKERGKQAFIVASGVAASPQMSMKLSETRLADHQQQQTDLNLPAMTLCVMVPRE
jgi:hypothetical protein